jgi:hypothetical protein
MGFIKITIFIISIMAEKPRNYSTISVSPATKSTLEEIAVRKETFDEIVQRLLEKAGYKEQLERAKRAQKH